MSDYVDFSEAKRVISVVDVLEACQISLDQLAIKADRISGVCPLPSHVHNPVKPNDQQFKADSKKGYWLWHCFAPECDQGGDTLALVKAVTGLSDQHLRLWLIEHFGSQLTLQKPKGQRKPPDTKKASEEDDPSQTDSPSPAETQTPATISDQAAQLKPLRWVYALDQNVPYLLNERRLRLCQIARSAGKAPLRTQGWSSECVRHDPEVPIMASGAKPRD